MPRWLLAARTRVPGGRQLGGRGEDEGLEPTYKCDGIYGQLSARDAVWEFCLLRATRTLYAPRDLCLCLCAL